MNGVSIYRINYLNLPVLVGYKITRHLQILLGMNLGILLNGKYNLSDTTHSTTNQFQRIDPGLDAGMRYELGRWGIDLSFLGSLIGIEKTNQTYYNSNILGEVFSQTGSLAESDKTKKSKF